MSVKDVVIVGAGPGGCAAAIQAKRLGLEPYLIDQEGQVGGLVRNGFWIENYLGHEPMDGRALVRRIEGHLQQFELSVRKNRMLALERTAEGLFNLQTVEGLIRARVVVLALGTLPKELPNNEFYELEDVCFHEVLPVLGKDAKLVVVVGAGEAACDYSLSLAREEKRVILLTRGKALRAKGRLAQMVKDNDLIELRCNCELKSFVRVPGGVRIGFEQEGQEMTMDASFALAAVGRKSALSIVKSGLDLRPSCGVSTGTPGLFVVGDARTGSLGQVGMAVGDGLDAAMRAASFLE